MSEGESFAGMTVNERLFAAGLMSDFDLALAEGDERTLRSLLGRVGLPDYPIQMLLRP